MVDAKALADLKRDIIRGQLESARDKGDLVELVLEENQLLIPQDRLFAFIRDKTTDWKRFDKGLLPYEFPMKAVYGKARLVSNDNIHIYVGDATYPCSKVTNPFIAVPIDSVKTVNVYRLIPKETKDKD